MLVEVGGQIGLLFLSALLFALSHPSLVFDWGFFPLAYVAFVPVFIVVHRSSWHGTVLYGLLYGFISYTTHNYWLLNFHPLSIFIVPVIYAVYFAVVFPLLKAADTLFPRYGFLVQLTIWLAYEYLRTRGFLGYAYGISGYSQYLVTPLVRLSALTGVWGVSLLVVFPSAFLGNALKNGVAEFGDFVRSRRFVLLGYAVLFLCAVVYGVVSRVDYRDSRMWRVALVQQNVDPWEGGVAAYRESLDILVRQSKLAVEEGPEIVIWSETSFVPSINYHTRYRTDPRSYALVRELVDFLAAQDVPYVVGNSDGRMVRNVDGSLERADYNAAILYADGTVVDTYRKIHLVPFTEHFPYRRAFPWLYRLLVENETTFWEAGEEYTVFEATGVRFSTPICFEDTFGYLSRGFVREGAEVIVNLTNDSWAHSVAAAMQHMAMAVFRATENGRSVVRSTNGGMTAIIDPNGRIIELFPPFVEGYLIGDVPVYTDRQTLYTRWGDWFAWLSIAAAVALLLLGVGRTLVSRGSDAAHHAR
ncbi:MAG: apolipoprotein N-acyltransferase [Spirochaetaceae bacterium]|nr:MAG: apolipoprotein N-acyltransferase [Spirochaetaceae bacterium]